MRIAISEAGTKQGKKCAASSQCSIVKYKVEKCVIRSSYSTVQYITVEVKLRSASPGASTVHVKCETRSWHNIRCEYATVSWYSTVKYMVRRRSVTSGAGTVLVNGDGGEKCDIRRWYSKV